MENVYTPSAASFLIFCAPPIVLGVLFLFLLRRRPVWFTRLPGTFRLLSLNLLALFFFATTALLAGETYYRFLYDTTDSYNYTFASVRWFQRYYHYNSAGLRDNIDYPPAIPPGSRRITFLGDSFTAAQGVKNVDDRFANRLRLAHRDWDVEVFAVNGMDTGAEIEALKGMNSQRYQMDLVVLAYCLNDTADLMPEWRQTLETLGLLFGETAHPRWLMANSYFADTAYHRFKARSHPELANYFSLVGASYTNQTWATQKARLTEIRDLVQGRGGRLVVVTFPFLHALGPNYPYQSIHDQLGQLWRDLAVPHLDLLPIYKNFPPSKLVINRLDAHPNEFAHALAAEALTPFLQTQLSIPPPKP